MSFDPLESLAILFLNSIESAVNKRRSAKRPDNTATAGEGSAAPAPEDLPVSDIADLPPAAR